MSARRATTRRRPARGLAGEPGFVRRYSLFRGDGFNRVLRRVRLAGPGTARLVLRIVALVAFLYGPMLVFAWRDGDLLNTTPRESLMLDLASWAQFLGFVPLALIAEVVIESRMRGAVPYLARVARPSSIAYLCAWASRLSRWWGADAVAVGLGYYLTALWWMDERFNGIATWHTGIDAAGQESFTRAGLWVAFVALPIFTYMWLRWVWKIGVWTAFLYRVSRLELRLIPAHPDRTGGLGCLSEVQTGFAIILFGTGVLFSMAISYKIEFEGTPLASYTVWAPIIGYVILAPAVFLAPLFMFTGPLSRARAAALLRYSAMAGALTERFEQVWLAEGASSDPDILADSSPTTLRDFRATFESVYAMRVIPFDFRSVVELIGSAAAPFSSLMFFAELPANVLSFISGA